MSDAVMFCPFCGNHLGEQMSDPWCETCRIYWTIDVDGFKQMHVGEDSRIFRSPSAVPFRSVPAALTPTGHSS